MADPITQEFLNRLEIMLSVSGVPNAAGAFKEIIKYEKLAVKGAEELIKKNKGMDKGVKASIESYKKRGKILDMSLKKTTRATTKATKAITHYGRAFNVLKRFVIESIKYTVEYNKELLISSAYANRLGVSIVSLERNFKRLTKTTAFTRMESVKLFNLYQKSMIGGSFFQFEKILTRATEAWGANNEKTQEYVIILTALSKKHYGLAKDIAEVTKETKAFVQAG